MNYFIADCHFGDQKVIAFSHRPFHTVEEMDRTLIENWRKRVRPADHVYILGDLVCRASDPEIYLQQLPGHLHLIVGNHDQAILKSPLLSSYFDEINNYQVIYEGSHRLVLFHYPILEWDGYYYGSWLIYGHIHNHPSETQARVALLKKALNAGVDITNFQPLNFDELVTANHRDGNRGFPFQ